LIERGSPENRLPLRNAVTFPVARPTWVVLSGCPHMSKNCPSV